MINLYGPVRVDPKLVSDKMAVTLSVPAWKEGQVVSKRFELPLEAEKFKQQVLPVSRELVWTIRHPDQSANIMQMKYSPDGKRLFFSGYPSGVVQFWDLENKKEIRRFEGPKGYRGSANYAHLTPDWKTLYIGEEKTKFNTIDDMGKKDSFIEPSGRVQVWDVETGEQNSFLYPATGNGAGYCQMSPDGKKLVLVEMKSYRVSEGGKTSLAQTSLWDLKTGERRVLGDSFMVPHFSRDNRFGFFSITNYDKKTSIIQKVDLNTLKVLAEFDCGEKDLRLNLQGVSPDDRWLVANLAGKLRAPPTTLFLSTQTLKEETRLVLAADTKGYGWQAGSFSPDGKIYETSDGQGNIHLWSLAEKKVIRVIPMENGSFIRAFRPDGKVLAVAWMPKYDEALDEARGDPNPLDLPQPRITLIDLPDPKAPPKTLIAPQGFIGTLQFRPDGKQLSFGSSGAVHIFDVENLLSPQGKK